MKRGVGLKNHEDKETKIIPHTAIIETKERQFVSQIFY